MGVQAVQSSPLAIGCAESPRTVFSFSAALEDSDQGDSSLALCRPVAREAPGRKLVFGPPHWPSAPNPICLFLPLDFLLPLALLRLSCCSHGASRKASRIPFPCLCQFTSWKCLIVEESVVQGFSNETLVLASDGSKLWTELRRQRGLCQFV